MTRGGDFYAVWNEETNSWSTNEMTVVNMVDQEIDNYCEQKKNTFIFPVTKHYMWDASSGAIDDWLKYVQRQCRDHFHNLDETVIFANTETCREDYSSKRLPYALESSSTDAYDELMSVLYSEEERKKIEWAIGAIVSGDSKTIQKFCVFYGAPGTGKSTILNIIEGMFDGYCSPFKAEDLGKVSKEFALEAFSTNPVVAIDQDGDLSGIENNTRLNSIVSHDVMLVNEKYRKAYPKKFKTFLMMATNKPVRITDAKSGLLRRLIDISPTGKIIKPVSKYNRLMNNVQYEYGGIAYKCKEFYEANKNLYDNYVPLSMMGATNDFYNFMLEMFDIYEETDGVALKEAYNAYKQYCEEANVFRKMSRKSFAEELKNYFNNFDERCLLDDGTRPRNYYHGFRKDKFKKQNAVSTIKDTNWIDLKEQHSILDDILADCPAQLANKNDKPTSKWADVTETLKDIDTSKTHFVMPGQIHIALDFDLCDENGNKSLERNIEAAKAFPPTYAEASKGGQGLHLHYIYDGDVSKLSHIIADKIEIKVFTGNSSLRRRVSLCNDIPVAHISSGLPLRKEKKLVDEHKIKDEKHLRAFVARNLHKEYCPGTKPSIDFIYDKLEETYNNGVFYDISDMFTPLLSFAMGSTNHKDYCKKKVRAMKLKSQEEVPQEVTDAPIVIFDLEVYPNFFGIVWTKLDSGVYVRWANPTGEQCEELFEYRIIGFNNKHYDNHILYARTLGYSNRALYELSQRIINGDKNAEFSIAKNLSYTDIHDFASTKQSLKKWEVKLGITHMEMGIPWDQDVPEDMIDNVMEYCENDVRATEALFHYKDIQSDYKARLMLADIAGGTPNDSTNTLSIKFIFGDNRKPQSEFNYRDMGDEDQIDYYIFNDQFCAFTKDNKPIFPGYKYEHGISTYRGEEVGEGGYVYAEPGIHENVALLDIASMHPSTIRAEVLFGEEYTQRFAEIVDIRLAIKHKDFDKVRHMLNGKLAKYLTDEGSAKSLAQALKIVINSVYGLTKAGFDNPFRDIRNADNIVAKRGALFMVNLKHAVQEKGFIVAHIKTDSIKIPNATPEIIEFVQEYGRHYGYNFEHEATYEKMCLVNDAVYIAKEQDGHWTATGTQFAVPYVFKTLFSHEPLTFDDFCELKTVSKGAIYLDYNETLVDVSDEEKELKKLKDKYKKGLINDTTYDKMATELEAEIAKGHDYKFVGRVGYFTPIKQGHGGAVMNRLVDGKYSAVTGTKGYRWLEAEIVSKQDNYMDIVDQSYYTSQVDDAIDAIAQYGDIEWFTS